MNELPNSAMGVMKLLPDSKGEIERFSQQLIASVQNGEVNPLQLKAFFKSMDAVVKRVDEHIKDNVNREADKYPGQSFSAYGFEIQKGYNGVEYDYLGCGDPIYEQLHASLATAKSQLEERAKFLRALTAPLTVVDDESGEIATIQPPQKKGTPGLKFFLK